MHNGGFGAGVDELVMCWIAGADGFATDEKYSCRCNQCKCCCCWRLFDVRVGAAGRYVTIKVMLTCIVDSVGGIDRGGSNCECRLYHLPPVNLFCALYVLAKMVASTILVCMGS